MISRFAGACCLGRSSSGWVSSVGAEPSPSHATGLPAAGAQPFPNAQQFASISAATRNAMDFEIIVIILQRGDQRSGLTLEPGTPHCTKITQVTLKNRVAQGRPSQMQILNRRS